jgi:hypothetical protein
MSPTAFHRSLLVLGLWASGCATAGRVAGVAGPVEWEVIDVGRVDSVDGNRTRWSYTIVLKEKAGTSVQFERIERGARAQTLETGGLARIEFARGLAAHGELRYHTTDDWGFVSGPGPQFGGVGTLGPLAMERQFIGKDSGGRAIVVPVRVVLDRSFGRASRQPPRSIPSAPPMKSLEPPDLRSLVGRWEGYYQTPGFQIPIEAVIGENGSVEFGENDPVTNRFRGTVSVRDGRVWYAARDTAEFTYHEGGGRHVLAGHLTPGGGGSTRIPVWLERTGSAPAAAVAPPSRTPDAGLPTAVRRAFQEYRDDPRYTHFKAFAVDRRSGVWGRSWSVPSAAAAMERALYECGKRSSACEVYAVGDSPLESVSPDQRAALLLGGAQLRYTGLLTTEREGRVETSAASVYLFRGRTEITGTWSRDDPPMMGVITGGVADTNRAAVQMTLTQPCRVEYAGNVSIGEGGRTLDASYTGPGCDGVPLKATFTGVRQ